LKDKTPEEVFSRMKPEVEHLRIFGCLVYIHVPKEKRTKMEPSGKKGVFVVYWSRWILVATHLFQLAQNNFLAILIIYYF
jgi:hypothetical protein